MVAITSSQAFNFPPYSMGPGAHMEIMPGAEYMYTHSLEELGE